MALGALAQPKVLQVLNPLARSRDLTIVVGAGASVEATLPAWSELVDELLATAAREVPSLVTKADRLSWIAETKRKDSLLGAGAVVEAISEGRLQDLLIAALFGKRGRGGFEPGPIATQIATLLLAEEGTVRVLTTNYDDLLERAVQLQDGDREVFPVTHLHGYAGRDAIRPPLILSEEQYSRMQQGQSWQEKLMLDRLNGSDCLFIGSSLSDPNLIRYLYAAKLDSGHQRAAVFIRQEDDLTPAVRAGRELATEMRWKRCGVEPVFLDHFCDVAQFVYEVRHLRSTLAGRTGYAPVVDRARAWLDGVSAEWFPRDSPERFRAQQNRLSDHLSGLLERALRSARLLGGRRSPGEQLQLVVWLADPEGKVLTGWAHSDRAHRDVRTLEPVPIVADSPWVAVRAFCQGTTFERDRDVYASRWKYVRGIPLIVEEPTRLPVGCVSVASTVPGRRTVLRRGMKESIRAEFNGFIATEVLDTLTRGGR